MTCPACGWGDAAKRGLCHRCWSGLLHLTYFLWAIGEKMPDDCWTGPKADEDDKR